MRILHTSDWHLGRSFHREGMLTHQGAYADHLLEVVESEQVDLVVVSGDVYDRALPQVDAVAFADDTFSRLAASRAKVVVSSGNHDSAQRLGFGSRLIDAAGVFVRTRPGEVGTPVLLDDAHGQVAVHAIPFLEPAVVSPAWSLRSRSHEAALTEAMHRVRADLSARRHTRSVVLAHAFVAGCAPSDSERDISVGGVSMVSADVFQGIDYVAMGHLHGAQRVTEQVRYSGSPLAYSFSEATHLKGSWLIDLGAGGIAATTFIPAPVPRPLARLRGTLEELLSDPALAGDEAAWVQATLTDDSRPVQPMERLRRRFPHALVLGFEPTRETPLTSARRRWHERDDHEIALAFVKDLRGRGATPAESALLREAVDACGHDREQDAGWGG